MKTLLKLSKCFRKSFMFVFRIQTKFDEISSTDILNFDAWNEAQIDSVCLISMFFQ